MPLKGPRPQGVANRLSTAGSLPLGVGRQIRPGAVHGYYIDFTSKADEPVWPPPWLPPRDEQLHVEVTQWGLGCFERFLAGDGDAWLDAAAAAADHLIEHQEASGGWPHLQPMPHTYAIEAPWLSAMAQGEAASLLVRLHGARGEERFAEAALRALEPMALPVAEGGVRDELDGVPFLEEYPTAPGSHVLNGAIFALWGYYDVGVGLDEAAARHDFQECVDALAARIDRFDNGRWSLYDLFPHPLPNVASGAYHTLHIDQLRALERIAPRAELKQARERFELYRESRAKRWRAFAEKVAFRLAVPRSRLLTGRLPWSERATGDRRGGGAGGDRLVLCYHAVSEEWDADLSVTPRAFEEQVEALVERGYRGVTFSDLIWGDVAGKTVAITFDDAYASVIDRAFPILSRHGLVATVFTVTAFAGAAEPMSWPGVEGWREGSFESELTAMSWMQLETLAAAGWEIGSHTRSHPRLTELGDEGLEAELLESRRECERFLGRPCRTIAYPYGDHDQRVIDAAWRAGYSAACTLPARLHRPAPLRWPRIGVYHGDDIKRFERKISPAMRRLRASGLWGAVTAARRLRAGPGQA
ncbi:MAG: hypothetical protein QOJ38_555 [Solirubrobacterales bacterium]|nr:hypothetical protein [Solirubrobacterales bacterium]